MRGDHNGLGRDLPDAPMPRPPRGLVIIGGLVLLGAIMLLTMLLDELERDQDGHTTSKQGP